MNCSSLTLSTQPCCMHYWLSKGTEVLYTRLALALPIVSKSITQLDSLQAH